jgi:CRP-like cAMP-binding protein
LIDADPDLARFLTDEEHEGADWLTLPVRAVPGDDVDVGAMLREANAFGVLVLDGMLVHRVRIGEHPALRLLGPGDLFWLGDEPSTTLLAESGCSALAGSRLALLGNSLLIGAHRFPRLIQGLFARVSEQDERAAAHLAMAELPRVDERLMALMWLLAERWGHVTPVGTRLPLALTHEALGGLIGARRSTVTLALRQLIRAGRLVAQDDGWLILEPPPQPGGAPV